MNPWKPLISTIGLLILSACQSFPRPPLVYSDLPTINDHPEESKIMLRDERHLRFFSRAGQPVMEETQIEVTKVLTQAGLEKLGVYTSYDRTFTIVTGFQVRTTRPDGEVEIYSRSDALDVSAWPGSQLYIDDRVLVLRLRDEPIGTVVESVITRLHVRPSISQYSFLFGGFVPSKHLEFSATFPKDWSVETVAHQEGRRMKFDASVDDSQPNLRTLSWRKKDLPKFVSEVDGPEIGRKLPMVRVMLTGWTERGERKQGLQTIADYAKWIYELQDGTANSNAEMAALVAKLTKHAKSPREKAKILYDWVQENIRYVGVQVGLGGWRPFPATKVFDNGYGDCKAKANILKSFLDTAGISSSMASLYKNNGPPQRFWLPAIGNTNHAILAIDLPEGVVIVDPTTRVVPFGELPVADQGQYLLRFSKENQEPFLTPSTSAEQNVRRTKLLLTLTDAGKLKGSFEHQSTGSFASNLEYRILLVNASKKETPIRDELSLRRGELSEVNTNLDQSALKNRKVKVTGEILIDDGVKSTGKIRLLRLEDLFEPWASKYSNEVRSQKIKFSTRRIQETEMQVKLPDQASIRSLPPPVKIEGPGLEYSLRWLFDGKTLTVKRSYKRTKRFYPAADYLKLKGFYDQLLAAEAKAVVIR